MTGKASTALVEGLVNNTAMPTILNISAYKFVALDQLPTLQEQLLAAALRCGILLPTDKIQRRADPCLIVPLR